MWSPKPSDMQASNFRLPSSEMPRPLTFLLPLPLVSGTSLMSCSGPLQSRHCIFFSEHTAH